MGVPSLLVTFLSTVTSTLFVIFGTQTLAQGYTSHTAEGLRLWVFSLLFVLYIFIGQVATVFVNNLPLHRKVLRIGRMIGLSILFVWSCFLVQFQKYDTTSNLWVYFSVSYWYLLTGAMFLLTEHIRFQISLAYGIDLRYEE